MKTYKISEVLYWTIAGISIYKFISFGDMIKQELIISLVLLFYQYLWHFLEDILEKSITKGTRTLNDSF